MIRALFHQASDPQKLELLGLVEVLEWAGEALNRVDHEAFFTQFEVDQAVQYFYEPFLEAFDPELRRELGVWYTPREIVRSRTRRARAKRAQLHWQALKIDSSGVSLSRTRQDHVNTGRAT